MNSFLIFDFLWKLLIVVSLGSTFILGSFVLVLPFLKGSSGAFSNRLAQASIVSSLVLIGMAALLLSTLDKDLQVRCFGSFAETQRSFGMTRTLALLWFAGVLVGLSRDFWQLWRFKKILGLHILQEKNGYWLVTDQIPAMSLGWASGQIFIPQRIELDEKQLSHVLMHEKIHIKNKDGLWSLLAMALGRICWFNPLALIFEKNRVLAMEMATDEETIATNKLHPFEYAQSLVNSLAGLEKPLLGQATAAANFKQLKIRIHRMAPLPVSGRKKIFRYLVLISMALGWFVGISQSFASIKMKPSESTNEVMCYQVRHEQIIENWLHIQAENKINKCE